MLLIELGLQRSFDLGHLLLAKLVLDPTDDDLFGQISKRHHLALGALQAKAAIGASGIGAVVGINGVVGGEDIAVSGFTLQLGDLPGEGGIDGRYDLEGVGVNVAGVRSE